MELPAQGVGQFLRAGAVQGQALSVQVQELEPLQLFLGQLGHVARGAVGVAAAHQHGVLYEQVHELGEGEKVPLFLVGLQPVVQLQNGLQGADGQDVAALGHVGLHARKDVQPVGQLQHVLRPAAHRGQVAVQVVELQGIEVLGEAQGVQPGPVGLVKEPVGIGGGKGQLFGQLSVGVKIKSQGKNLLSEQSGAENAQGHPQGGECQE